MTAHIVNLGSPAHRRTQDLLPWFVMGTLDAEEREAVAAHLRECTACQRDVHWHENLHRAEADSAGAAAYDADRAFAALCQRLRAETPAPTAPRSGIAWRRYWAAARTGRLREWRLAAGFVLGSLVSFGAYRLVYPPPHAYHALSRNTEATPARLVVVFAPQTSEARLRNVLLASAARIVDGPTAADAYTLAVAPRHLEQAMTQLRAEPSVLFVQALDAKDMR